MTDFASRATTYAELGFRVFPCRPNAKTPLTQHGLNEATNDEFQIAAWSDTWPNANIGLATEGLIVVDRDVLPDGSQNPWPADSRQRDDLFKAPTAVTPRGGNHHFFRAPVGSNFRNSAGAIAPNVDIRATGGYVVAVGSEVDGKRYQWLSDDNELSCAPDKLPVTPIWLLTLIEKSKQTKPSLSAEAAAGDGSRIINNGSRNCELTRYAGWLRRGGSSEAETLAALVERNKLCNPPLPDAEVHTIAHSVARYEPDQITQLSIEAGQLGPAVGTEAAMADPGHIPRELLKVPGLVGSIMEYNLATAYLPQPELALAAALCLAGVAMGRKVKDCRGLRTNTMIIGLAGSGTGKEWGRKINKRLLVASGLDRLTQFEELASAAALHSALGASPALLWQCDEIGQFLQTAKDPRSAWWRYEICTLMLKLYSQADDVFQGKGHGGRETVKVIQPHFVLYGTSVLQSVLNSMTQENLSDGFLSRLLLIESSSPNPTPNRLAVVADPPGDLIAELEYWRDFNPGGGNLSHLSPTPRVLHDGPGVTDLFYEQDLVFRKKLDPNRPAMGIWTRATEKARQLALIYACSVCNEAVEIDMAAARWALHLVEHLTDRMIFLAGDWVADGKVDGDKLSIIRTIRRMGGKASQSQLLSRHRRIKGKEMREYLEDLQAEGAIKLTEIKTGGRPKFEYELITRR